MGKRRMFSKNVIGTDKFFDMSSKTQLIYFYLNLEADDDGFIGNIKKQMRMLGGTAKQLDELVQNGYIIIFDSGVAVISHWHVHNSIRKDRYTQTAFCDELDKLELNDKNVYQPATKRQPNGDETDDLSATQDRLSKVKLSKANKRESEKRKETAPTPRGEMNNVVLTDEEYGKLKSKYLDIDPLIDRFSVYMASTGKKYPSHYATLIRWAEEDAAGTSTKTAPLSGDSTLRYHTPNRDSGSSAIKTKAAVPKRESSFDIDEFYRLACSGDLRSCLT